jgi:polysaccharide export outer membrane protein
MGLPAMSPHAASPARRLIMLAAMAVALPLLAGCGGDIGPSSPQTITTGPRPPASSYQIGAGDHLQVFVYESPTLSVGDTPVRPDGRISLPLVPDIQAAGRTPSELAADITVRLQKFVKDPNVSVIVHNFVGTYDRQIKVIGEATEPLALPYSDGMTVLDVVIASKGLTKFAAGNRAIILRRTGNQQEKIPVHLNDLIRDGDVTQNVAMQPGDTLIIPQTYF